MPSSTDITMGAVWRSFSLPSTSPDRIHAITGRMSWEGCTLLAETVRRLDQESDAPILFLIDSPGGTGPAGEMLTAVISFCRSPTIGLVGCRAVSAGFEILQACDLRLAFAASFVLTHFSYQAPGGFAISSASDIDGLTRYKEAQLRLYTSMWTQTVDSLCRRTGIAPELARQILSRDRFIPAKEACALGFLDGIVGR
jgi:ATP-dependent protease ClpP protease subunit